MPEDLKLVQSKAPIADSDVQVLQAMTIAENAPISLPSDFDVLDMTRKIRKLCEVCSGITFHPYQTEYAEGIIETVLRNDGEEITALFSRQSGKSETNACVMAGLAIIIPALAKWFPNYEPLQGYKDGFWVGIFAPSGEQTNTTYSRTVQRIKHENAQMVMEEEELQIQLKKVSGHIKLTNGSIIFPMSANKNANIESKTYHFLLMEECQDIDDRVIRKSIQPMGASTNATVVKVGTANDRRSDFSEAIRRNRRKNLKGRRQFHFQYDYRVVERYNPRYAKYIEREKERLGGETSDEFRMAYLCEFLFERGMFMTEDRLEEIFRMSGKYNMETEHHSGTQVVGIDVAKKKDSTVVTIMDVDWDEPCKIDDFTGEAYYMKKVIYWLEMRGDDYDQQFMEILRVISNFNVQRIVCDATGVGEALADRLVNYYQDDIEIEKFVFSTPTKSKLYLNFMQEMNGNRIKLPNGSLAERNRTWKNCKNQLLELTKEYKGDYLICKHPDEKDAHDDYPDSMALACWGAREESMAEIEVESIDFFHENTRRTSIFGGVGRRGL